MNRNDTNLLRDVIIAYVDGRNIQSRRKGSEKWNDDEYPQFDSSAYEYRIKPEYRPFGNRNECIEGILNNGSKGFVIDRDGNKDDISWMIEDKAMIPWPEMFRMAMKGCMPCLRRHSLKHINNHLKNSHGNPVGELII